MIPKDDKIWKQPWHVNSEGSFWRNRALLGGGMATLAQIANGEVVASQEQVAHISRMVELAKQYCVRQPRDN